MVIPLQFHTDDIPVCMVLLLLYSNNTLDAEDDQIMNNDEGV